MYIKPGKTLILKAASRFLNYFSLTMSSILLTEYLDESESKDLAEKLRAAGVTPMVKRHGLPRFFGAEINFKIIIDQTDMEKAGPVFRQFQDDQNKARDDRKQLQTTQCPWCSSTNICKRDKTSIWEKFRFYGVDSWRCKECGGGWYL